jgi:hypothetical protein
VEFIVTFLIGFFSYWILTKEDLLSKQSSTCPEKESIVRIAETCSIDSYKLRKNLKDYSLIKIQEGRYEYADVLETLKRK